VHIIYHRKTAKKFLVQAFFSVLLMSGFTASAQTDIAAGKTSFANNCASCHNPLKDGTGPALHGITERVPDRAKLHAWIKNNRAVLASGDPYFNQLFIERNKTPMNLFTTLSDAEIDNIIAYVESVKPATPGENPTPGENNQTESDNSLLYGILTLILAIVTLILLQVNSNLKKLSDDKEGVPASEPVPFYRNKAYIAMFAVVLFIVGGYMTIQAAIGLGRNKGYQPEQPIFYSHKVHAGVNQVSCLYCHSGAYEGKHANVPSVNVCMNCHMAINEYSSTSEKLYREDGTEVNGTAEIQKIYAASGWDPKAKQTIIGRSKPGPGRTRRERHFAPGGDPGRAGQEGGTVSHRVRLPGCHAPAETPNQPQGTTRRGRQPVPPVS